jgi:DNA-binding NarL/FixJ family response regulator
MRILLVDDHRIVRDGLRRCLADEPDWQVVGEAEHGRDAIRLAHELVPDIVVMDLAMPEMNGVEATRRILEDSDHAIRVLILSMHSDREFVTESLKAGASGFILKDAAFEELVGAIKHAMAGNVYLSPPVAQTVVEHHIKQPSKPDTSPFDALTAREREILQLLAEGHDAKAIGLKLGINHKTVHTFRARISEKLQISSVAEMTKYAIRHGLTTLGR